MKTNNFDIEAMLKNIDFSRSKLEDRRLQVFYVAVEKEDRYIAEPCSKDSTYFVSYKTFLEIVRDRIKNIGAYEGRSLELIPNLVACTEKEATIIVLVKRKN